MSWRRKWQPTPVFLPGKSHGWRSLVGYSPCACKESDTIEWLHFPPRRRKEWLGSWFKFKSFCTMKETISKVKRQPSEWEKMIANENWNTCKELISKIYKQLMLLNTITKNNPFNKWAKDLNRHFSKEDIQMANKHMKWWSTSRIIRETQIKTIMRYHIMLVRIAAIKKSTNNKWGRKCREKESFYTAGGNAN